MKQLTNIHLAQPNTPTTNPEGSEGSFQITGPPTFRNITVLLVDPDVKLTTSSKITQPFFKSGHSWFTILMMKGDLERIKRREGQKISKVTRY